MLVEIECFVNYARRRSPGTRTWKDYACYSDNNLDGLRYNLEVWSHK